MVWRRSGDKPLSEPMMVRLPTHICVTRPQWVTGNWTPRKQISVKFEYIKRTNFIQETECRLQIAANCFGFNVLALVCFSEQHVTVSVQTHVSCVTGKIADALDTSCVILCSELSITINSVHEKLLKNARLRFLGNIWWIKGCVSKSWKFDVRSGMVSHQVKPYAKKRWQLGACLRFSGIG